MAFENFNNQPAPKRAKQLNSQEVIIDNNSGRGANTQVPDIVAKRFNWGAFLLSWIWGLGNKTYITLLIIAVSFIPIINFFVPLIMCIWFGIEGNAWAWQNKRFQSVEHFHSYQRKWAIAGIIPLVIVLLVIIGMIASTALPTVVSDTKAMSNQSAGLKSLTTASEVIQMSGALEKKCDLSSEGLARCFAEQMNITSINGNVIEAADSTVWTFNGDGTCYKAGKCEVLVENQGEKLFILPLNVTEEGYLNFDTEVIEKIRSEIK